MILGSLIFYNFKLKAVYDSKSYLDPYNGMEYTPLSGVEKLNFKSTYNTKVKIEQGLKEGIWIDTEIKDRVKFSLINNKLDIEINGRKERSYESKIIIITRTISELVINQNEYKAGESFFEGRITVSNYNVNKLSSYQSGNVNIQFLDMKIDTLDAVVGKELGYSELEFSTDSQVKVANYDIGVRGSLKLSNTKVRVNNNQDTSANTTVQK